VGISGKCWNRGHRGMRGVLRVVGAIVAGVGVIFEIVGFASGSADRGGLGEGKYTWCFVLGILLFVVGAALRKLGQVGKVARDVSGETASSELK